MVTLQSEGDFPDNDSAIGVSNDALNFSIPLKPLRKCNGESGAGMCLFLCWGSQSAKFGANDGSDRTTLRVVLLLSIPVLCSIEPRMEEPIILSESRVSFSDGIFYDDFTNSILVNYVLPNDSV